MEKAGRSDLTIPKNNGEEIGESNSSSFKSRAAASRLQQGATVTATQRTMSIEEVLDAYARGFFPMASGKNGHIDFYFYEPRGVIPLDSRFTVRKSLRQIINRKQHTIKFDTAFEEVIRSCARHNLPRHEIWLSNEM